MKNTNKLCVLITGATGYIGENLARRMAANGAVVHVVIRKGSNATNIGEFLPPSQIHVHDQSIGSMIEIFNAINPDIVFHLASLYLTEHQPDQVIDLINSNVQFLAQLLEAMYLGKTKYLVNTGTSWQHFNGEEYSPVNLYAATKQAGECLIKYYDEARGLKVINLHLYDTYGPTDPRKKLFSLLREAINQKSVLEMSGGKQLIDLVYIDDVIDCYIQAMNLLMNDEPDKYVGTYAVSSGCPIELKELVTLYFKLANKSANISWGARPYRKREVMVPWTGLRLPHWTPKVVLEEGIQKILYSNKK